MFSAKGLLNRIVRTAPFESHEYDEIEAVGVIAIARSTELRFIASLNVTTTGVPRGTSVAPAEGEADTADGGVESIANELLSSQTEEIPSDTHTRTIATPASIAGTIHAYLPAPCGARTGPATGAHVIPPSEEKDMFTRR